MNDDTDFDFDVSPAPAANEAAASPSPEVQASNIPASAQAPQVSGSDAAEPTHHIHTRSGTVTVVGRDVMAALIEALSEVHRRGQ